MAMLFIRSSNRRQTLHMNATKSFNHHDKMSHKKPIEATKGRFLLKPPRSCSEFMRTMRTIMFSTVFLVMAVAGRRIRIGTLIG